MRGGGGRGRCEGGRGVALRMRGVEVSGKGGDKVGGGLLGYFDGISFQVKAY